MGGVPEHFNLPWHLWLENGGPEKLGLKVEWRDFPGGSGAMIQALEAGETDLALVLTEAVVHAIARGSPIQPLSVYVESPLVWGIFSGIDNPVNSVDSKPNPVYAISRMGSGSHLMAKVDAHFRQRKIEDHQWRVVQNLEGAKKALENGEADLFFWEKWMTKPLVDAGILKMVDERPTPWSCFLLVGKKDGLADSQLSLIQEVFQQVVNKAQIFIQQPNRAEILAQRYGLQLADAEEWLRKIVWATEWKNPGVELEKANRILTSVASKV